MQFTCVTCSDYKSRKHFLNSICPPVITLWGYLVCVICHCNFLFNIIQTLQNDCTNIGDVYEPLSGQTKDYKIVFVASTLITQH
jgi:hypothetical protein